VSFVPFANKTYYWDPQTLPTKKNKLHVEVYFRDLVKSILKPLSVGSLKLKSDALLPGLDEGLPWGGHPLGLLLVFDGDLAPVDLILKNGVAISRQYIKGQSNLYQYLARVGCSKTIRAAINNKIFKGFSYAHKSFYAVASNTLNYVKAFGVVYN